MMTPPEEFDHWTSTGTQTTGPGDATTSAPVALLVATIADVEPLGDQRGIHAKACVPDALTHVLFGQPEPTPAEIAAAGGKAAAVPPLGTFAILDAARIRGLADMLSGWALENRCLYQGEAFERLRDVAPWIVRLDPESSFTRHLFTKGDARWHLWGADAGIFVRSRGSIDALWAHFRKFTNPRSESGGNVYFRFYDPRAAQVYFTGISTWPERVAQFFQTRTDHAVQAIIAIPAGDGQAVCFMPTADGPTPAPAFSMLTERDSQIIADGTRRRFRTELKAWMLRYDKVRFGTFEPAQLDAIVDHVLREGDTFALSFKEEFTYLLYIMCHFGSWFHTSNRFPDLVHIFRHEGQGRMVALSRAFPAEFARQFGNGIDVFSLWKTLMAELEADLASGGGWAALTRTRTGAMLDRASRHLAPDDRTRLGAFLKQTAAENTAAAVATEAGQCVAQILSYVIGYRFAADPLFPWAADLLREGPTPDDAMLQIGAYALKRARRMRIASEGET